jgi:hypothetical protein
LPYVSLEELGSVDELDGSTELLLGMVLEELERGTDELYLTSALGLFGS